MNKDRTIEVGRFFRWEEINADTYRQFHKRVSELEQSLKDRDEVIKELGDRSEEFGSNFYQDEDAEL